MGRQKKQTGVFIWKIQEQKVMKKWGSDVGELHSRRVKQFGLERWWNDCV